MMKKNQNKISINRYNNIDAIRMIAAISIICMHIQANIGFKICGGKITEFIVNNLISSAGVLVQLFFVISAFSICCGYYDKIKNNKISINEFYIKRYSRILPFFTVLVLLDLISTLLINKNISASTLYEAFADLSLVFGFLPASNISVIGVGWTLGVIFGFYLLFPFFVFLLWDKKRVWFTLVITIILNYLCEIYFLSDEKVVAANTIRWICYFVAGGALFLYKENISKFYNKLGHKYGVAFSVIIVMVGLLMGQLFKFDIDNNLQSLFMTIKNLISFSLVVIGAIGFDHKIFSNYVTKFLSNVSFEIYLSHMLVFRGIEVLGLSNIFGENLASYVFVCILTIILSIIFALIVKFLPNSLAKFKKCK